MAVPKMPDSNNSSRQGEALGRELSNAYRMDAEAGKVIESLVSKIDAAILRHSIRDRAATVANQGFCGIDCQQHYQPIVSAQTLQAVGYESLIRPAAHLPPPHVLVSNLEANGQVASLDLWSLCAAIRTASALKTISGPISVNVSGQSISDEAFCRSALELIYACEKPHRIGFEITESAPITDMAVARDFVSKIRKIGCIVGMDDVGTGHAKMDAVEILGLDFIKIPGEITTRKMQNSLSMIQDAIVYARSHKVFLIAEHVDNAEQFRWLRSMGVDMVQGWLFDKAASEISPNACYRNTLELSDGQYAS